MNKTTSLYRPCIGIMVINQSGKVLVCRRADLPESESAWQMVQGGVDENEAPICAAFRELEEETNIQRQEVERVDLWEEFQYYDFPFEQKTPYSEYVGQKQQWLIVKYLKDDNSIDLRKAKDKEFDSYKWITMSEAVDLIWQPKKPIYKRLATRYKEHLAI
ncbi:MAG TPA: RNA pyrophosphohydrolase [Alphaproteobacteria bacterium]|nr:RNA pyrophosphohydrolase [Alphaproteobacteria bacterium]